MKMEYRDKPFKKVFAITLKLLAYYQKQSSKICMLILIQ